MSSGAVCVHRGCARPTHVGRGVTRRLGKSDFVELRRMELERYLRRLLQHPVVGRSEVREQCGAPLSQRMQS